MIVDKLKGEPLDSKKTKEYAGAQWALIMNEYLEYAHTTPAVEAFREKFRMHVEPRDFVGIDAMITRYISLVFEQERSRIDPIYQAFYPTVLDAVAEKMEGMMSTLLNTKKHIVL